jgi:hypothetical protein
LRVDYYKIQGFFRKIFYERKPDCRLISIKFKVFFVKCLRFAWSWLSARPIGRSETAGDLARSGARAWLRFTITEIRWVSLEQHATWERWGGLNEKQRGSFPVAVLLEPLD